jgi:hypothetical protein
MNIEEVSDETASGIRIRTFNLTLDSGNIYKSVFTWKHGNISYTTFSADGKPVLPTGVPPGFPDPSTNMDFDTSMAFKKDFGNIYRTLILFDIIPMLEDIEKRSVKL